MTDASKPQPIAGLTPEWLRRQAADQHAIVLLTSESMRLVADAIEIADESAWSFIECECRSVSLAGSEWCDLADTSDVELSAETQKRIRESLAQSVRYLETRGLIERHADRQNLVRVVERPA